MVMNRDDGRAYDQVRPIKLTYNKFGYADSSLLFELGRTKVLVSVSIQNGVPFFLKGRDKGWLTAEYAMLPCATLKRNVRESCLRQRNSRSVEISRLIGRSLRAVTNLDSIGERTIIIDCDVLQADGSTRVACITGASIALELAMNRWLKNGTIKSVFVKESIAAISVGIVNGNMYLDLSQYEDNFADADFNFILTKSGSIIEIQGTAEKRPISWEDFEQFKKFALVGVKNIFDVKEKNFVNKIYEKTSGIQKASFFSIVNRQSSK